MATKNPPGPTLGGNTTDPERTNTDANSGGTKRLFIYPHIFVCVENISLIPHGLNTTILFLANDSTDGLNAGVVAGGGVGGAFLLVALLVFILARRRRKENAGNFAILSIRVKSQVS